jgi:hypothetical protein
MRFRVSQQLGDPVIVRARSREDAEARIKSEGNAGLVLGPVELGGSGSREHGTSKGSEVEIEYKVRLALGTLKIQNVSAGARPIAAPARESLVPQTELTEIEERDQKGVLRQIGFDIAKSTWLTDKTGRSATERVPPAQNVVSYKSLPKRGGGRLTGAGNSAAVHSWFQSLGRERSALQQLQTGLDAQKRLLQETVSDHGRKVGRALQRETPKLATRLVRRAGEVPGLLRQYREQQDLTNEAALELDAAVAESVRAMNELAVAGLNVKVITLRRKREALQRQARSVEELMAQNKELVALIAKGANLDVKGAAIDVASTIVSRHMDANARQELDRIGSDIARIDAEIAAADDAIYVIALHAAREGVSRAFSNAALAGAKLNRYSRGSQDVLNDLATFEKTHGSGTVFKQIRDYYVFAKREGEVLYEQARGYIAMLKGPTFGAAPKVRRLVESDMRHVEIEERSDDELWWSSARSVTKYLDRFHVWQTSEVVKHERLLASIRSRTHLAAVDDAIEGLRTALGAWDPFSTSVATP